MKHQLLKPSQHLQLDGSTILANKTEQMPQQYQMNGKSKSNSASMNENNKTAMKMKQPFGKKHSGLWAKNGNYVEIEEKPEPTPNRFELFGLRPIKRQIPPPSKPKQNQKLMATKSIGEATLKRNWTDNILAGRRWSMKNPLDHLLKEQQKQQNKKTSTKMVKPKPNKKENVPMEEKQQNEENSGELTNKVEEGIIEKGQSVEPIIKKKRGRPPKEIANSKKKKVKETKQKKRGRKPKNTGMLNKEDGIIEKAQPAEPIIKKRGRPKGKRNNWYWEPVTEEEEESEPVVKKTRTRGAKKNEEKLVEEKLVEVEQQLEANQQQIEQQEEEEIIEDLPTIVVSGHPSSPPTPPQSPTSSSISTPNSATTTNPNEFSPELAKVLEFKQRLLKVDDRGYLKCPNNSLINKRFDVETRLGDGEFSNVYLVRDWQDNGKKAIKIIRNTPEYMAAAEEEIEMLNYLDEIDPEKKEQLVIRKLETFRVEQFGHHCILFPMYGKDVNTFMKANKYHPFPLEQIRYMTYQLIHATNFLHKHHVIHTDLKPENILFVRDKFVTKTAKKIKILQDATIRLCDIGNAVFVAQPQKDKCVSTSHYRAPEAILEIGFDHSCDVWSLGCIIFELYAGHFLIPKVSDLTHLQMLERILGTTNTIPKWMREETKKPNLFDNQLNLLKLKQPQEERDSGCKIEDAKPLKSYIYAGHEDDSDHKALFDLIAQMLIHDPKMRVKLATAQNHEFFKSLEPALRAKVDRGGWDEDKKQPQNQRNKIYPSKVKQNGQQQSGIIAENFDADGNRGGAGPSHK